MTVAKTLNQQQAVAELPIAGIRGEIVRARFGDRPESAGINLGEARPCLLPGPQSKPIFVSTNSLHLVRYAEVKSPVTGDECQNSSLVAHGSESFLALSG